MYFGNSSIYATALTGMLFLSIRELEDTTAQQQQQQQQQGQQA
jgi:hypothetical protein